MPDPTEGVAGQRSRGVMARTQKRTPAEGDSLVPPASLDLDFVPDGLLETEREIDDAKAFGIRPFTVGNIVDRLVGATEREDEGGEIARFLWRLLTRERASEFSISAALERTREFDPSALVLADGQWPRSRAAESSTEHGEGAVTGAGRFVAACRKPRLRRRLGGGDRVGAAAVAGA